MNRAIKTLLFDLDETIYPSRIGLLREVGRRIGEYIQMKFAVPHEEAEKIRIAYKDEFGSTLQGLYRKDNINPSDYTDFVYNIDYASFLTENKRLYEVLAKLPQNKIIYTNGAKVHAYAVLKEMGIPVDIFKSVISIEDTEYYAKPNSQSYEIMIQKTGIIPEDSLFFDDQQRNIAAGEKHGIAGVVVQKDLEDILHTMFMSK